MDVGALVAGAELGRDILDRPLAVAELEHLDRGLVEGDGTFGEEQDVPLAHAVPVQPEAVRERRHV